MKWSDEEWLKIPKRQKNRRYIVRVEKHRRDGVVDEAFLLVVRYVDKQWLVSHTPPTDRYGATAFNLRQASLLAQVYEDAGMGYVHAIVLPLKARAQIMPELEIECGADEALEDVSQDV